MDPLPIRQVFWLRQVHPAVLPSWVEAELAVDPGEITREVLETRLVLAVAVAVGKAFRAEVVRKAL